MKRVIVGTAGHVDHGKTRLVEALTGIDCDRWEEEKSRGITIDLGFAHLERGDLQIGFIDVPGHERFLPNALAGLGGIRIVLLVVAADEGVGQQTREHLEICSLLEIPAAVVALTKSDRVDEERLGLARLEVEELLGPTCYASSPIYPVSATSRQGLDPLETKLLELASLHAVEVDPTRPARLPIDRAFQLKGLGTIVTGTLIEGVVRAGEELELLPGGSRARVRSLQVHGVERSEARKGERVALQIAGLAGHEIGRGRELVRPGAYRTSSSLIAELASSPGSPIVIEGSTPIAFHLDAIELPGRVRPLEGPIEPGTSGAVLIRLEGAVVAAHGDRFVLRRPSPPALIGGGRVLDPEASGMRGARRQRFLDALRGDGGDTLHLWAEQRGEAGLTAQAAARRLGRSVEAVERELSDLVAAGRLLALPARERTSYVAPRIVRRVAERARTELASYAKRNRLSPGMPRAELAQRILPRAASGLVDTYLSWLEAQGAVVLEDGRATLPGAGSGLDEKESALATALTDLFRAAGLTPPSPTSLARELGAKSAILEGVVGHLVDRGRLVRLPGGLVVSPDAIDRAVAELRSTGWERFTVPQFKELLGLTRKWAIPLLEHLDSTGVTQRIGNERWIRPPAQPGG